MTDADAAPLRQPLHDDLRRAVVDAVLQQLPDVRVGPIELLLEDGQEAAHRRLQRLQPVVARD